MSVILLDRHAAFCMLGANACDVVHGVVTVINVISSTLYRSRVHRHHVPGNAGAILPSIIAHHVAWRPVIHNTLRGNLSSER
jgi:hypothetical protein